MFTFAIAVALALILSFLASLPKEGSFAARIAAGIRRLSGDRRKQRLQRGLVVAQVAVSVVLLAAAGLLTRTMVQLSQVNTGLKAQEVLTVQVQLLRARGSRRCCRPTQPRRCATIRSAVRSRDCRVSSKSAWAPALHFGRRSRRSR